MTADENKLEWAVDILEQWIPWAHHNDDGTDAGCDCRDLHDALTYSVGILKEHKTGHWVECKTATPGVREYECSCCGRVLPVTRRDRLFDSEGSLTYPYCHCGAKMHKEVLYGKRKVKR